MAAILDDRLIQRVEVVPEMRWRIEGNATLLIALFPRKMRLLVSTLVPSVASSISSHCDVRESRKHASVLGNVYMLFD